MRGKEYSKGIAVHTPPAAAGVRSSPHNLLERARAPLPCPRRHDGAAASGSVSQACSGGEETPNDLNGRQRRASELRGERGVSAVSTLRPTTIGILAPSCSFRCRSGGLTHTSEVFMYSLSNTRVIASLLFAATAFVACDDDDDPVTPRSIAVTLTQTSGSAAQGRGGRHQTWNQASRTRSTGNASLARFRAPSGPERGHQYAAGQCHALE